ncbi:MAG: peptidoglycan DD-metalloendopeptidase family protein [Candidatus Aenigmarchaeota archaeon]|nr:peptidoglycan DD-metalloendopeptidase family protein [Candidatus Aenigmarchaeota archaeon]
MKYKLPVKRKFIEKISSKSPAHKGSLKNAVDFYVPEGTPVFAIADGVVIEIKDDSNIGGGDPKYWYNGNFVIIKHSEKIYSEYEHFKYKGVTVKEGQKVKTGDLIGFAGNTGYSHRPHLHLELRKKIGPGEEDEDFITIKIEFEGIDKSEINN